MASGQTQNAGTGSYVAAPENVQQPQQPVDEQLSQLKIAAKNKINDLVTSSKEQFANSRNNPANRASDDRLAQDAAVTTQDATQSYNTALRQLGEAFHTAETTGKQVAQQMGLVGNQAAAGAQDLTGAARQEAQQKSQDAQLHVQDGKSALQQGIATVQEALSQGAAVANQKLQEGAHSADTTSGPNATTTESRALAQAGEPQSPTLFQSVTAVLSQTALSVKEALVGKSAAAPTSNAYTASPTTTNQTVTHPPAQTVTESIAQTATALKDALKETWAPTTAPPAAQPANNVNPGLPADVPRRASE